MDGKSEFISLEMFLRGYIPQLNHYVKENIIHPKENCLQILDGEKVLRTIREEESELLWYAGIKALEGLANNYLIKE